MQRSEFVQLVKVLGAEEAIRTLQALGLETSKLGDDTEDAAKKSGEASQSTDMLAGAAKRFVGAYVGFEGVVRLFREYTAHLREAVELQDKLANQAVEFANDVATLAGQLRVSQEQAVQVVTTLGTSGGLERNQAREFAVSADIAFADRGGLLGGNNFAIAQAIAPAISVLKLSPEEAGGLMNVLKDANMLGSVDEAKLAISQLVSGYRSSRAQTMGEFVAQIARGGRPYLQSGMSLAEVIDVAAMTRQVEVNGQLAATTMEQLLYTTAYGADPGMKSLINRRAREEGIDPRQLTSADRIRLGLAIFRDIDTQREEDMIARRMSPERAAAELKAFRASNVEATSAVGEAVASATVASLDEELRRGQQEITFRQKQNQAATDAMLYETGVGTFTLAQARERARAMVERDKAERGSSFFLSDEAEEERYVLALLRSRRLALKRMGLDTSRIDAAILGQGAYASGGRVYSPDLGGVGDLERRIMETGGEGLGPWNGYNDAWLDRIAREISRVESSQRRTPVINNIGTVYQTTDPLTEPPPVQDLDD